MRTLVETLMGPDRYAKFEFFCGDCVPRKKPNPDVYNLAAEAMDGVDSSRWRLARENGTPSRWEAHPTVLDGDEGIEVASERAKKDAVWREEKRKDEEDDGGV